MLKNHKWFKCGSPEPSIAPLMITCLFLGMIIGFYIGCRWVEKDISRIEQCVLTSELQQCVDKEQDCASKIAMHQKIVTEYLVVEKPEACRSGVIHHLP